MHDTSFVNRQVKAYDIASRTDGLFHRTGFTNRQNSPHRSRDHNPVRRLRGLHRSGREAFAFDFAAKIIAAAYRRLQRTGV